MNDFLRSWLKSYNKIVVFAGVFDPVHRAHLSAAETALRTVKRVVFLPERVPQHKHGSVAYEHRLEMLKLATANHERFDVADYPEDHHYIEPVFQWLQNQYPGHRFVWLVGSDVLEHMGQWDGIERLSKLGVDGVYYFDRDGSELGQSHEIVPGQKAHRLTRPRRWNTRRTHAAMSSTKIRSNIKEHKQQLPTSVYDYIVQHKLYTRSS